MKKLAAVLAASLIACSWMSASAEDSRRSVTTTGNGIVTTRNDTAVLNLVVETSSPEAKQAIQDNANIMTRVKQAAINAGANPTKIETTDYNLYPLNEYDNRGKVVARKYQASNMIKLVVDDIKNTGRVMDAAVSAGANRIDSIRFTVRDADKYKDEALKRATKDAERKAKMIAASLGKNVTNVIAVNENHVNVSPRYMMNVKMAADSGMGNATTPMEGGDASVESSVTIVFEIG